MAGPKKRAKTGCVTCRQRRVKCDERKPFCRRCEVSNISCSGYQALRRLASPRPLRDHRNAIETDLQSLVSKTMAIEEVEAPLINYPSNPEASQRPHQRALEILGHQQYSSRTARMLFRDDHLYFWRDYILKTAWDTEYVFDAVLALGIVHRALVMLSDPSHKWLGVDNKVVAFQIYANALRGLSVECGKNPGPPSEILVAVLLLLTYFECFVGNHKVAFQHLRTAQSHLDETDHSLMSNAEPLTTCIKELGLVIQIVLPLPLIKFPLAATTAPMLAPSSLDCPRGCSQDLQQLLSLVCAHRRINIAIWSSLCNTEYHLTHQALTDFQSSLLRWKAQSISTFREYDESPNPLEFADPFNTLPIPPKAQSFISMDAALAAAIFNCYMGRVMCMISTATGGDENCEKAAFLHAYHNLRIVQGIEQDTCERSFKKRQYFACNAVKIGFIPLLFLGSQFCYDTTWLQFTIGKLISIGQEGLYDGKVFATALQLLGLFQAHAERLPTLQPVDEVPMSSSLACPLRFRVVCILIPSPEDNKAVAYYVRALKYNPQDNVSNRCKHVQIVGKAMLEKRTENASNSASMEFFDPSHPINQGLREHCLYFQLASSEPIAQEWETLLGKEALGPYGYFVRVAALRDSITKRINSAQEPNLVMEVL